MSGRELAVVTGAARGIGAACASRFARELGAPRVLVTSAALIPDTESVLDMDLDAHDRMWRVNYHGTLHACRSFGRRMRAAGRGAMVTMGSINTLHALPLPAYNPGKAAVYRLMQVHALERLPEPADVAEAVAFLCSSQASMITGVLLPVDAGWSSAVSYNTYAGGVPRAANTENSR